MRSFLLLHYVIGVRRSSDRRTAINYMYVERRITPLELFIIIAASRLQRRDRAVVLSVVSFTAKETHRHCKSDQQTLQKRPTDTAQRGLVHCLLSRTPPPSERGEAPGSKSMFSLSSDIFFSFTSLLPHAGADSCVFF